MIDLFNVTIGSDIECECMNTVCELQDEDIGSSLFIKMMLFWNCVTIGFIGMMFSMTKNDN